MKRILFSLLIIGLLLVTTTNVLGKHNIMYVNNPNVKPVSGSNNLVERIGYWRNILITGTGKVYVWGWNNGGALGLGDTNNRNTPTENTNLEQIIQENGGVENIYKTLHYNYVSSFIIFKNGKVFVWGANIYGLLGLGDTNNRNVSTENTKLEQIIQDNGGINNIYDFYQGFGHNILVFKNGKVYVWGRNDVGQLGLGYTTTSSPYTITTPTENSKLEQIIQENGDVQNIQGLYVGYNHNILIFKNGKVYVWGYNGYGQLGLGDTTSRDVPTESTILENIIQQNGGTQNIQRIYTYIYYNILVFRNGKVYVWGYNSNGELGLNDTKYRKIPVENPHLEQIIQENGGINSIQGLYVGGYHNILVFKNGKVYVWGYNNYGQLGLGDTTNRNTPTENTNLEQIIQENGGVSNIQRLYPGGHHNILIFENGKVYVWGYNYHGELGLGDTNYRNTPTENTKLEQIIQQYGFPILSGSELVNLVFII